MSPGVPSLDRISVGNYFYFGKDALKTLTQTSCRHGPKTQFFRKNFRFSGKQRLIHMGSGYKTRTQKSD